MTSTWELICFMFCSTRKEIYSRTVHQKELLAAEAETKVKFYEEQREEWDKLIEARIRHRLHLSEKELPVIKDDYISVSESEEEEEEEEFPGK